MISASEPTATLSSWLVFSPSRDAQRSTARHRSSAYWEAVVAKLRDLAPYSAILIVPGGSLMVLLLWLYRRQKRAAFLAAR
jgi:hypothetical protein